MQSFLQKNSKISKWHANCITFCKSDTLISFLLKKVYFVPQSGPFSILTMYICPTPSLVILFLYISPVEMANKQRLGYET